MRREWLGVVLALLATVGAVLAALGYEQARAHRRKTINLIALAPEKGNWQPREIVVTERQPVRLRVRNVDTVSHGFAIPELEVGFVELKPGEIRLVEFTAPTAGRYPFLCTVWCSRDHMRMAGELVVLGTGEALASVQ